MRSSNSWTLPFDIGKIGTPPLKCQGIKSKLVPFIAQSITWDPKSSGRWIEPFLGTGSVVLNLAPPRALLGDINPHMIGLLKAIQGGLITPEAARETLLEMGRILSKEGQSFYYEVRDRFNDNGSPMDFLFLNRASFNGVIRFNKKGRFNTPFGHKPERFQGSFITKVCNQIAWARKQMVGKEWEFVVSDWRTLLAEANENDFIYIDPPYIGRHADYFSQWSQEEASDLAALTRKTGVGYALSMWLENSYRKNDHIETDWPDSEIRLASHFYHVGSTESLRGSMTEALAIAKGYASPDRGIFVSGRSIADRLADRTPKLFDEVAV